MLEFLRNASPQQLATWSLITVTAVFAAWNAGRLSRKSSRRSEARAAITRAQDDARALADRAREYWLSEPTTGSHICAASQRIVQDFDDLDQLVSSLSDRHPKLDALDELVRFRQQVMARPFQMRERKALPADHVRLASIAEAARNLHTALETGFQKTFK